MCLGPFGTQHKQTPNSYVVFPGSQTVGSKFHSQKEKSPDRRIRPPNHSYSVKEVELLRQPGGWLRSSHPLKKA